MTPSLTQITVSRHDGKTCIVVVIPDLILNPGGLHNVQTCEKLFKDAEENRNEYNKLFVLGDFFTNLAANGTFASHMNKPREVVNAEEVYNTNRS